jgi:hypothetical protein
MEYRRTAAKYRAGGFPCYSGWRRYKTRARLAEGFEKAAWRPWRKVTEMELLLEPDRTPDGRWIVQ